MSEVLDKLPHRKSLTRFVIANDPRCLGQRNMEDRHMAEPQASGRGHSEHQRSPLPLRREAPIATPPYLRSSACLTCTGSHTCYDLLHLKRKNTLTPLLFSHCPIFLFFVSKFLPPMSLELTLIRLPSPPPTTP